MELRVPVPSAASTATSKFRDPNSEPAESEFGEESVSLRCCHIVSAFAAEKVRHLTEQDKPRVEPPYNAEPRRTEA